MAHTERDEALAARFFGPHVDLAMADVTLLEGAEVRLAYHDPEGGWWFSSGGSEKDEELGAVCLPCLIHEHPNLVTFADLPLNWIAALGAEDAWGREPRPESWGAWSAVPPD